MSAQLAEWRAQVRDWVTTEIGVYADLRIRGWSVCNLLPSGKMPPGWIRMQVDATASDSRACGYVSTDESFVIYGSEALAQKTARGYVLREFLHVLGLRDDLPRTMPSVDCIETGDPVLADGYSILNYGYCWGSGFDQVTGIDLDRVARLRPKDVFRLQAEYDRKPAGSIVGLNNRCLSADNPKAPSEPESCEQLLLSGCVGSANQRWRLSQDAGVYLSAYSNYNTLDVDGSVAADGIRVWNYSHNATAAQQWYLLYASLRIMGDLCLEIADTSAPLDLEGQVSACTGGIGQAWHLNSLGTSDALGNANFQIRSAISGGSSEYCLQATEDMRLIVQSCVSTEPAQAFRFYAGGRIRTYQNGCVDLQAGRTTNGSKVQVYDCWDDYYPGRVSQQWFVRGIIRSALGRCLDVESDQGYEDGTRVQTWTCNGNVTQTWDFWP
jgi:hypothetical protein